MTSNFNLYGQYYDLFYQEKDTEGECQYIANIIGKYAVPNNKLLEFGCGSGRHGKFFNQMGWQWNGIEKSNQMALLAKAEGLQVYEGDIAQFNLNQQFSAVLALFHVISYLTDNSSLQATFANAYAHLEPGGVFIFDVWYSPAVYLQQPEERIKEVENEYIRVIRKATPLIDWNQNLVEVVYDIDIFPKVEGKPEVFRECHPMRHFSIPELKLITAFTGFTWLHAEEWMTGKTPGRDTWGVCCIVKK